MRGGRKEFVHAHKGLEKIPKIFAYILGGGKKVHEKTFKIFEKTCLSIFSTGVMNGYKFFEKRFF